MWPGMQSNGAVQAGMRLLQQHPNTLAILGRLMGMGGGELPSPQTNNTHTWLR